MKKYLTIEQTIINALKTRNGKATIGEILSTINASSNKTYDCYMMIDWLSNMRRKNLITLKGVRVRLSPIMK